MKNQKNIYAYASAGIVPVRRQDSETAEMVSQILLGETVQVLESRERWHRVKSDFDGYEGWVSTSQIKFLNESDYLAWTTHPERRPSLHFAYRIRRGNKTVLMVPAGAPIVYTGFSVELPDGPWEVVHETLQLKEHAMMDTAMNLLGVPYLWGGRTDSGIDCSGFVQLVYALHRYYLPRDAWQQHAFAPLKEGGLQNAVYGDIIYFSNDGKKITHTGFYLGEGSLLHASGSVEVHCIDPAKRSSSRLVFNERLSQTVAGVQSFSALKSAASHLSGGVLNP